MFIEVKALITTIMTSGGKDEYQVLLTGITLDDWTMVKKLSKKLLHSSKLHRGLFRGWDLQWLRKQKGLHTLYARDQGECENVKSKCTYVVCAYVRVCVCVRARRYVCVKEKSRELIGEVGGKWGRGVS